MTPSNDAASRVQPSADASLTIAGENCAVGLDEAPVATRSSAEDEPGSESGAAVEQITSLADQQQALVAEKQAFERTAVARRQELERMALMLTARLQDIHERERRLDEEQEQSAGRQTLGDRESLATATAEAACFRSRLAEYQTALARTEQERDEAKAELEQLQIRYLELEQYNDEQVAALLLLRKERQQERDDWPLDSPNQSAVPTSPQEIQGVASWPGAPRFEDLEAPRAALSPPPPVENPLAAQDWGERIRKYSQDRQLLADEAKRLHEREVALQERTATLRNELTREQQRIEQTATAAAHHREEVLRERSLLAKQLQELSGRERELRKRIEDADRDFGAEQHRLDSIEAGLAEFSKQFEVERGDFDKKQRGLEENAQKIRELERSLRLREAEIREMRDVVEQELADARDELVKERLRVARLREKLRLEKLEFDRREPESE